MESNQPGQGAETSELQQAPSDIVLDLNFVPAWARTPPSGANYFARRDAGGEGREAAPGEDRRGGKRRRSAKRDGDRHPGRRPPQDGFRKEQAARPERPAPLPLHVRFLPEARALERVAVLIRKSRRSYPLLNIASLFINRPETCEVRIEPDTAAGGMSFHQCRLCGYVSMSRRGAEGHLAAAHIDEYFAKEESPVEAPSGNFMCVARCGLSGILLGPPNHHSFQEKIRDVHRSRYSHMPIDEYRRHIEMVRDPALIEAWKQEYVKQTRYRLRESSGAPSAGPMKRAEAEAWIAANVADTQIAEVRKAALRADVARTLDDRPLLRSVEEAWNREVKFPRSLLVALRGALVHRYHMHIFRAGKGGYFVCSIRPVPLEPQHAVEAIRDVLTYLRDNPGSTREKMLAALRPGVSEGDPAAKEVLGHLAWLIERGHIIEFFDGTLSVPLGRSEESSPAGSAVPPSGEDAAAKSAQA